MENHSKKNIMITGANGYLGSKLSKYFSNLNYKILCTYNKNIHKRIKKKNVKYIKLNLLKKIPKNKINKEFDAILHFAGPKNHRTYVNKNKNKILEGIKIDRNIIKFCLKKKIKLFIYASSSAVYDLKEGVKKNKSSFKEENVNNNTSFDGTYGFAKKSTENYLAKISAKNFKYISCRIFSVYDKDTRTIINDWKKKINKGKKIQIWGNNIIRSWLHLDDFLKAIDCVLNKNKKFNIINIGSNESTSLEQIAFIIHKKLNKKKINIETIYSKYPGPKVRYANQNKLKKLGWRQKISLSQGIDLI